MAASVRADLRIGANSSFQLVLWSVSSSKLLPDNVEQYITPEGESFHLAEKNVIGEPLGPYTFTVVFQVGNLFVLDRSFDDILRVSVTFSE